MVKGTELAVVPDTRLTRYSPLWSQVTQFPESGSDGVLSSGVLHMGLNRKINARKSDVGRQA
jgi:hypothetical protein